jgi:hypothetical protein
MRNVFIFAFALLTVMGLAGKLQADRVCGNVTNRALCELSLQANDSEARARARALGMGDYSQR